VVVASACARGGTSAVASGSETPRVSATSSSPGGPSQNPAGVPLPSFVGGHQGITGPTVIASGVVTFQIGNNERGEHRFVFVRVEPAQSAGEIVAQVRREAGSWPPASVQVLAEEAMRPGQRIATVQVRPLEPGYYALVDVATDPATGRPYACELPFVHMVEVIPYPS